MEAYVGHRRAMVAASSGAALLAVVVGVTLVMTGVLPAGAGVEVSRWEPGQPTFTAPTDSPPIVGVNYHGLWDDMTAQRRGAVLDALAATGASWVRLDVSWSMLQPNGPDSYDMGWGVPAGHRPR